MDPAPPIGNYRRPRDSGPASRTQLLELPEPLLDETEKIGSEVSRRFGAREGLQGILAPLDGLERDPQAQPPDARRRRQAKRRLVLLDRFLLTIHPSSHPARTLFKVPLPYMPC